MRVVPFAAVLLAVASATETAAGEPVLLTSRRAGWLDAMNLDTLETVSRVRVPRLTESVASDSSGRLYITAPRSLEEGCCALFALDARTMRLRFLAEPVLTANAAATRGFSNRGDMEIGRAHV